MLVAVMAVAVSAAVRKPVLEMVVVLNELAVIAVDTVRLLAATRPVTLAVLITSAPDTVVVRAKSPMTMVRAPAPT